MALRITSDVKYPIRGLQTSQTLVFDVAKCSYLLHSKIHNPYVVYGCPYANWLLLYCYSNQWRENGKSSTLENTVQMKRLPKLLRNQMN